MQKGAIPDVPNKNPSLKFGQVGLKTKEGGRVLAKELAAVLTFLKRRLKKIGRVYLRVKPVISISRKPLESRLGGGKGSVETWGFRVRPNTVLIEISPISQNQINQNVDDAQLLAWSQLLLLASVRLRVHTKLVFKLPFEISTSPSSWSSSDSHSGDATNLFSRGQKTSRALTNSYS